MKNYLIQNHQNRILELEKENLELRKDNAWLKDLVSDYREGLIISRETKPQINPVFEVEEPRKESLPLWKLTNAEREVLKILIVEKDKGISRDELAQRLWSNSVVSVSSRKTRLSTIMKKLRMKLKIEDGEQEIIRTIWGTGYQLTKNFFDFYRIEDNFLKENERTQKFC